MFELKEVEKVKLSSSGAGDTASKPATVFLS